MIRPLRERHRHLVIALGIFLPVAFAAGIAARRPVPSMSALPDKLVAATAKFEFSAWRRTDLFAQSPVQVRLLRKTAGADRFAVELSAAGNFVKPDLIVYWVAGNSVITDTLPNDAILLGSFGSVPLPLPEEIAKASGQLVLFSLADTEIVDVSKTIQLSNSMK